MRGDFSRLPFDPRKRYTAVLVQQGRVLLDSDWNEQAAIAGHLGRTRFVDVVGEVAVPGGAGFEVHPGEDGSPALSAGRIYAGGLLCELETATPISRVARRELRPAPGRTDLFYLDAWERVVSAIDDPDLREPALGGAEAALRLQAAWAIDVAEDMGDGSCAEAAASLPRQRLGRLTADAPGGYLGAENRLYRVEIHDGGPLGQATFKWSRENGSVVVAIERLLRPDAVLLADAGTARVAVGDWFEVGSDDRERLGLAGTLTRVAAWSEETREATFDRDVSVHAAETRPRMRRWQGGGDDVPSVAPTWFELEDGIRVRFAGSGFRTGDYWTIPARAGSQTVEPLLDSPPHGVDHRLCPLALVTWGRRGARPSAYRDCRPVVAPLTAMYEELLRLRAEVADLRRSLLEHPPESTGSPA